MSEQEEFEAWWDQDCDTTNNPFKNMSSLTYWAWEAWKAGRKAEREACAKVCEEHWDAANWCAKAIRARGLHDLNKQAEANGEDL